MRPWRVPVNWLSRVNRLTVRNKTKNRSMRLGRERGGPRASRVRSSYCSCSLIEIARVGQESTAVLTASSGSPWGSITMAIVSSSWSNVFGAYQQHCPEPMHRLRSTRISRWAVSAMGSVSHCEVEVEGGDAVEHVRLQVVVVAAAGGAVRCLVDADVGRPVEQPLDRDAHLRPGKRRSRAGVNAVAEGDVAAYVLPVHPELGRALELARVEVGGAVRQEDLGAGRDAHPA